MTPEQKTQILSIIDRVDDLTIATLRADGYPQATTVSYVHDGLAIYFGTWTKSQKAQNIARDPRVSITINRPYKTWDEIEGLSLGGRARRVVDPAEAERIGALMVKRFPQIAAFLQTVDAAEMAFIRIDPEVISILDYRKGFGHTELVTV